MEFSKSSIDRIILFDLTSDKVKSNKDETENSIFDSDYELNNNDNSLFSYEEDSKTVLCDEAEFNGKKTNKQHKSTKSLNDSSNKYDEPTTPDTDETTPPSNNEPLPDEPVPTEPEEPTTPTIDEPVPPEPDEPTEPDINDQIRKKLFDDISSKRKENSNSYKNRKDFLVKASDELYNDIHDAETESSELISDIKEDINNENINNIFKLYAKKNDGAWESLIQDINKLPLSNSDYKKIIKYLSICIIEYGSEYGIYTEDLNNDFDELLKQKELNKDEILTCFSKISIRLSNYKTEDDEANGEIDKDFSQGGVGDCWLLATINSLANTPSGLEILNDSVEVLDDGSVKVKLRGPEVEYIITEEELYGTDEYSTGDMDVRAIEIAFEKFLNEHEYKNFNTIENGAYFYLAFDVLTGAPDKNYWETVDFSKWYNHIGSNSDDKNFLEKVKDDRYACTASIGTTKKLKKTTCNGEPVTELPGGHAYSIIDADDKYVYIVNPWDTSKVIKMPISEFKKTFDAVCACNVQDNVKRIHGYEYNVQKEYDDNGNLKTERYFIENSSAGIKYSYDENGKVTVNLYDIDKKGNIIDKWEITEEQAQIILERGILNISKDYTVGGLSNDIYVMKIWEISDQKWDLLDDYFLNLSSEQIDLQTLAKYSKFSTGDIKKALKVLMKTKKLPAEILYLRLSGMWSEKEFLQYLKEHKIDSKYYKENFN